ncbi:hypothetical protein PSME7519_20020 [Ectopseudomonas mendocina]
MGQLQHRWVRGLEEGVVERQLQHLFGSCSDQFLAAIADGHAPQAGHAIEDLVALAVPQVHTFGLSDDARALLGQLLVITERRQVVSLAQRLPVCGFRVIHVASFDPGHHRYQRYSRGLMSCMKAR